MAQHSLPNYEVCHKTGPLASPVPRCPQVSSPNGAPFTPLDPLALGRLSLGSDHDRPGPRPRNEPGPTCAWGLFQHGRARPGPRRRGQKKARPAHPAGRPGPGPALWAPARAAAASGPKARPPTCWAGSGSIEPRPGPGLIAMTARTLAPRARGQPTQRASRRQLESATEHERTPTRPGCIAAFFELELREPIGGNIQ